MLRQPVSRAALAALAISITALAGCISSGAAPVTAEAEAPVVVEENAAATPTGAVSTQAPSAFEKSTTPCGDLVVIRPRGPSAAVGVAKDMPGDKTPPRPLLAFDCGNESDTTL